MKSDKKRERWIRDQRIKIWGPVYRKLPFPALLHILLSCGQFTSDLWWIEGGKAFAINRDGYKKHIMNVFFDEHKFRSLQTLLHKYGFRRIQSQIQIEVLPLDVRVQDVIIYEHDFFVEGDFDSSMMITRVKKPTLSTYATPVSSPMIIANISVVSTDSFCRSISDMDSDEIASFDCCSLGSIDSQPLKSDLQV